MAKPIGPLCNLDCSYCFYLEKEHAYPPREKFRMPDAVLEQYVRSYIDAQATPEVEFTWQGGEPTLLGVDFFRQALAYQRQYANGKTVRNTLQTNGTLLDAEWGEFLSTEKFLVGLSLDGPRELHDIHRYDKQHRSSFDNTLRGLDVLKQYGVEFNVLVTVSREISRQPLLVYRFLKEQGVKHIQFNPVVERPPQPQEQVIQLHFSQPPTLRGTTFRKKQQSRPVTPEVTLQSVEPEAYGDFLIAIYDEWVRSDVGTVHVMNFEWALSAWCQMPASVCLFSPRCGKAAIVEHDGSVYSCDHFMYSDYKLGNLQQDDVATMMKSPAQQAFGAAKEESLPGVCQRCTYRFACHGECPKNRFAFSADGEPGLNYLCGSYLKFFTHITKTMNAMARLLEHGQPASLIMEAIKGPLIVKLK
ncbi:MAG TPA: anaerobic sulfatase maturase [Burkholderiaceae bacterium]|jgi:uncharacterized protein|nr:anaerobic sulfatase maturase [Burkholderiaceae bacterium]